MREGVRDKHCSRNLFVESVFLNKSTFQACNFLHIELGHHMFHPSCKIDYTFPIHAIQSVLAEDKLDNRSLYVELEAHCIPPQLAHMTSHIGPGLHRSHHYYKFDCTFPTRTTRSVR